ncbi:MAG TPA: zinc ribbon domain-containing protein [Erythrobacter sp.]|nr:zinc ribbon domain-containing protein [Erythrobacter sp.]
MPIFEYRCRKCETRFERIVFRNSNDVHCPNCQDEQVERLLSTFAISGTSNGNGRSQAMAACGPGRFT